MVVKSKIYQLRKDVRFTQTDLAKAAGISRQAYTSIEKGKSVPSTEVALRLARALKTSVEDLFWLEDDSDVIIKAELVGESNLVSQGTRLNLVRFGSQIQARPIQEGLFAHHVINQADGIAVTTHEDNKISIKVINPEALRIPTILISGCDPSTAILVSLMRDLGIRLVWLESESIPSLHALALGQVHIAGCSFRDNKTNLYNLPLVKKIVPFPCTIIRFAIWRQGMIVSRGNPRSIKRIDDLTMPNINIINRQPGSGSRGLLSRLMWESGISTNNIQGFDKIVRGDLAAAEVVASGLADCGIGIEASARANRLEFLPLNEEPYDLVIPNHYLELPAVQSLLELLKHTNFRRQIESLGGYDTSPMGVSYN
jgi:putative molybdopterin biosynthesis protein